MRCDCINNSTFTLWAFKFIDSLKVLIDDCGVSVLEIQSNNMPDNIIFLYYGMLLFNINIIEASKLRIIGADDMHVCPGSILTLECTVDGGRGDSTVWEGTALGDCEIILLHHRFRRPTGTFGMCNNGAIIGQSVSEVEGNITSLRLYISQLEVAITADMIRMSIECTHDDGAVHTIGHYRINIGTQCIELCY